MRCSYRPSGLTHREFISEDLAFEHRGELVDLAAYRGSLFVAWRRDDGLVGALVGSFYWRNPMYFDRNFCWELEAETEAYKPACYAPSRILDLLSSPEDLYDTVSDRRRAALWRQRCRTYHEMRSAKPKLRPGQLVEFSRPLRFVSGAEHKLLVYRGGSTFEVHGKLFHVRNWRDRTFAVRAVERGDVSAGDLLAAAVGGGAGESPLNQFLD